MLDSGHGFGAHRKIEMKVCHDGAGQVSIATFIDGRNEGITKIRGMVSLIVCHVVNAPHAEDGECHPEQDIVAVACSANVVFVDKPNRLFAHERLGVIRVYLALRNLDPFFDELTFAVQNIGDTLRQACDGLPHLISIVLSSGMNKRLTENVARFDTMSEREPWGRTFADGTQNSLTSSKQCSFDRVGDYMDLWDIVNTC